MAAVAVVAEKGGETRGRGSERGRGRGGGAGVPETALLNNTALARRVGMGSRLPNARGAIETPANTAPIAAGKRARESNTQDKHAHISGIFSVLHKESVDFHDRIPISIHSVDFFHD